MIKKAEPLVGAAADALKTAVARLSITKEAFMNDGIIQDATLMRLQEAGEYLARIRDGFPDYYQDHDSLGWNSLIGLRNIIAHGYLQIDMNKVWHIMQKDVPELIKELEELT